jgi:hypothetical protein
MAIRLDHQRKNNQCPACGGSLVRALGCTCDANAHTCAPVICTVCDGTGR